MSEHSASSEHSPHSESALAPVVLSGAGVVVTGAARGIGAALARAFAAEGARVVVNDVDADAARELVAQIGSSAFAVPGDAASESGAALLVRSARELLGDIDVYCANAGVGPAGTEQAAEDVWAQAWDVNVMAHVRAARELVPGWLERGSGCFVATVSAAGLLTMLGSAPYAVSKHGALAFAEWLSASYRHRGIRVHAVCPQGVRTRMLSESGSTGEAILAAGAVEPEAVSAAVIDALREEPDRFMVLPHAEVAGYYAARAADPDRWLAGMNKLQRRTEAGAAGV